MTASCIGIIAGKGNLPVRIIETCQKKGLDFFVVALEGHADPKTVENVPHFWSRMGAVGKIIKRMKREGVNKIVMAGGVKRPSLWEMRPDLKAAAMFAKLGKAFLGDDGLLREVTSLLEKEGFEVLGPHQIVDDLLASEGIQTKTKPKKSDKDDIETGIKISQIIGGLDVGQACVVQQGFVLGVEAVEGTEKLIHRCEDLKRKGRGPILIKTKKPQQDTRVDLPTIGVATVEQVASAGFVGIAVQSGNCLIVDKDATYKRANELKIFIVGIDIKHPD